MGSKISCRSFAALELLSYHLESCWAGLQLSCQGLTRQCQAELCCAWRSVYLYAVCIRQQLDIIVPVVLMLFDVWSEVRDICSFNTCPLDVGLQ